MSAEVMDLDQVAAFLQRDAREVARLVNRGYLPGRKVGGEWRFTRAEVTRWVETQMHAYTETELANLEGAANGEPEQIIGTVLPDRCVAVPLQARTRASVLKELVTLAEQSWQVYDPEAILDALNKREELGSTALENGVAIPHPHRPLPNALGESVVAFGRTASGVPFGGGRSGLTDLFFLVLCRDDRSHLRTLARLSRLLLRPGLLDELRAAETAPEAFRVLADSERELLGLGEEK